MKNYYDILEVSRNASNEVIDKAYKVLVKKYHPDLYSTKDKKINEKKLKDINEAYGVLSDVFLREQYDKELEEQEKRRIYEQEENIRYEQNERENYEQNNKEEGNSKRKTKINRIGSLGSLIDLTKLIFRNRPEISERKNMTKKDLLAVGLTIIVVIIIGIVLWFIPFTNGWMRELIFENPFFRWMFK